MDGFGFVRWKDKLFETSYLIKRMICNPLMMMLKCLWIVITCQEETWIENSKILAEQDRKNGHDQMPNEFIQGNAVTVSDSLCPEIQSIILLFMLGSICITISSCSFGIAMAILDVLLEFRA